jgi:mitogen-activated protein kinase kinase
VAALADPNELFLPGERQSNLAMSSSVPLLRPPVPGGRNNNGSPRAPKLTLGIPPSPSAKPVNGSAPALMPQPAPQPVPHIQTQPTPQPQRPSGRPAPPRLQLATPMDSQQNVSQPALMPNGRPAPPPLTTNGLGGAPKLSLQTNGTPANSYSTINFAMGLRQPDGSSDPSSAISSVYSDREGGDRDNSVNGLLPDLDKLSLEKGRPLDVDDLDDEGWHAASEQNKIVELGSLGEGAGGAVTRCRLKEGKTVFALKVSNFVLTLLVLGKLTANQIITTDPNPDVKKQIVRELNFNKDCASHHICRYYGAFMDKSTGTISIAMEFCEGGSLDSIYREVKKLGGRTGEKVLGKVAEGVLNGLTYLHSRKIIHRGKNTLCRYRLASVINGLQISNPPTFFCAATARSSFAILVSAVNLALKVTPTPSLVHLTTWPQNVSLVNHTPSPLTFGLSV